ncbi:MAG: sialidase family protein [Planctomycetaceae bacterium]
MTFPSATLLPDGSLLATCRRGSTKDCDDETVELRRSRDGGRTWSQPQTPYSNLLNGRRGSLKVCYLTPLGGRRLIACGMWVDREAFPGKPLFNEQTEGCLPMTVILADSQDLGETWSAWRVLPLPDDLGPPSLTSPLLRLRSGRLVVSIESNKSYLDTSKWYQRVAYAYSDDLGATWSRATTVCQDPTARIFNWDQRAGVGPNGEIVTFTSTYDREAQKYLNVHRRISRDEGDGRGPSRKTWDLPISRHGRRSCRTVGLCWRGSTGSGRDRSARASRNRSTRRFRSRRKSSSTNCRLRPNGLPSRRRANCWRRWVCGTSDCHTRKSCRTATCLCCTTRVRRRR